MGRHGSKDALNLACVLFVCWCDAHPIMSLSAVILRIQYGWPCPLESRFLLLSTCLGIARALQLGTAQTHSPLQWAVLCCCTVPFYSSYVMYALSKARDDS